MTENPYDVLGVSPNASDDDVKRAYRELSRKYHPDSYVNNPLADLAEEKFKAVQQAYNEIMTDRSYSGHSSRYSGTYRGNSSDAPDMQTVLNCLSSRRYSDALRVLAGISNRNSRWYYYSAIANEGIGNSSLAVEHANVAVNMEPDNMDYRNLVNQLTWQKERYRTGNVYYSGGRRNSGDELLDACCKLWCADSICECMGGDLCPCM